MTGSRLIALVAVVTTLVVVVAVIGFGDDDRYRYKLLFQNAGQLVKGDEVQIGGRGVGSVEEIVLTADNQAEVEISLDPEYAPLRYGTTATIRLTSLSGIANRYIALAPGPNSSSALADGSTLSSEHTTSPVEIDQLFNTFDAKTRRSLQQLIQGQATWYKGKGAEANRSAKYLNPALSTTDRLVSELARDQQAFTDFVVSSSQVVSALAERRDDLADLVGNANATARALGQDNVALAEALGLLPTTLRRANTTFVNLRATLDDLDELVDVSKPATKDLAPFLRELRPVLSEARPALEDLNVALRRVGSSNDLTEATRSLPSLGRNGKAAFSASIAALQKAQPVIEYARPYTPELIGWLRDFGQSAAFYDGNGHYARVSPIAGNFSFTDSAAGGVLTPQPQSKRYEGFQKGIIKRCPGSNSQVPEDSSAPFLDGGALGADDCDPTKLPPGP